MGGFADTQVRGTPSQCHAALRPQHRPAGTLQGQIYYFFEIPSIVRAKPMQEVPAVKNKAQKVIMYLEKNIFSIKYKSYLIVQFNFVV